ncbi:MAG: c-type cytochrome [Candidatus Rariloculaceae bacterium]
MKFPVFRISAFIALVTFSFVPQAQEFRGGNFMLTDALDAPKRYCLDLEGYAYITDLDAPVIVHSCKEGFFKDGTWMVDYPQPGQIYIPWYELCVAAGEAEQDAEVFLRECSDEPLQQFTFRDDAKVEVNSAPEEKFCLAVAETSRPTGNNLRRQTRMTSCDDTDESMTQWILPRDGQEYPIVIAEPVEDGAPPPPGIGMGAGGAMGMGMGGGMGPLFVGACSPCHAPNGNGYQSEFSPKISGQEDWYLSRQLMNFRNDVRGDDDSETWAKQMNFHIKDFGPTQLLSFVDYIQTLEDTPAETTIEGDTARGRQLYAQSCALCHGDNAMGSAALNSPRLAGMSDWYMVIQLEKFRSGLRGRHPDDIYGAQMVPFALTLPDDAALLDVVAHINTLAPQ